MSVLRLRRYEAMKAQNMIAQLTGNLNFQNDAFIWPSGPITIEFWNFVTEVFTSTTVRSRDDVSGSVRAHCPWGDNILYWDYGSGSGRITADYTGYENKWTHIALQSAGAGGSYRAIYLDGVLVNSSTAVSYGPADASMITVGQDHRGNIDEFRIWDNIRTQSEIQNNMYKKIQPQSGLLLYQRFDQENNRIYPDSSGNEFDFHSGTGTIPLEPSDIPGFQEY